MAMVMAREPKQDRSRVTRQHHFPTREDLITGALEYMFDTRMDSARREAQEIPAGPGRTKLVVERLVEYYTGPMFKAALQVWTAASADPELRDRIVPLEERFGRRAHKMAVENLGVDDNDPVTHRLVQATLDLARGLGLADVLTDDARRRAEVVRSWAEVLDASLNARLSAAPAGAR
jgi:AcrR family transcriptional regulator